MKQGLLAFSRVFIALKKAEDYGQEFDFKLLGNEKSIVFECLENEHMISLKPYYDFLEGLPEKNI